MVQNVSSQIQINKPTKLRERKNRFILHCENLAIHEAFISNMYYYEKPKGKQLLQSLNRRLAFIYTYTVYIHVCICKNAYRYLNIKEVFAHQNETTYTIADKDSLVLLIQVIVPICL